MNSKPHNSSPIGVFDSGLGGLSVWRELRRELPCESLIYLGDGKNCPYGSRSRAEIAVLADAAVGRLVELGCKIVVVACNTATAAAIEQLRSKYSDIQIVGMEPAIKPACLNTRSRVVGVLATERSLDGDMFRATAARYGSDVELITAPGRGFVELVESHKEQSPEADQTVRAAITDMIERGADQIVLGCTHYPLLMDAFKRVIGEGDVTIIDPAPAVARRVGQLLDCQQLRAPEGSTPTYSFVTFADSAYLSRLEAKAAEII